MKSMNFFHWFASVCLFFYILYIGKNFLIPLVLAIFIWFLINSFRTALEHLTIGGYQTPDWLAFTLAFVAIVTVAIFLLNIIMANLAELAAGAPVYEQRLNELIGQSFELVGIPESPTVSQLLGQIDLAGLLSQVIRALSGLIADTGVVALYLFFLFLEQGLFRSKLEALFPDTTRRAEVIKIVEQIDWDTRRYVGVKTLIGLFTAFISYAIMKFAGLSFAEFWALLIFILNFIPSIGPYFGAAIPTLFALLQFRHWFPIVEVAAGIFLVQSIIANFVEPRLMGSSLNLSPFIILVSLVFWGAIWGIPGMFLAVPIMSIAMIIFSYFSQTRPLAICLSAEGQIKELQSHPYPN